MSHQQERIFRENSLGASTGPRHDILGVVADELGNDREIVRLGHIWFYVDEEVAPGTDGAQDVCGHWYTPGSGIAMAE